MIYNGLKAIERRKTAARVNPIPNNQPLNPSRYNAIINVVNTSKEPTSGILRTAIAGTPIMASVVKKDFLLFKLKSGPET